MAATLENVRKRGAHRAPDAEQVDVDRLLDGLRGDKPQRAPGGDPGVGHGDVEAAEPVGERIDRGGQRDRVAHVGDGRLGAANPRCDALQAVAVDVDQPDPHPACR